MNCTEFESRLPEVIDDAVDLPAEMRAHMESCASCRGLFLDLRTIQSEATRLSPIAPGRDLWSGIADRIEAPVVPLAGTTTRMRLRRPSWTAAGIAAAALIVVTASVTYRMARRPTTAVAPVSTVAASPVSPSVDSQPIPAPKVRLASNVPVAEYDRQIASLRAVLDSGRGRLDPATLAILERNLRMIDSAIAQCRGALASDPASQFLFESLNKAYQSKVRLLRVAANATKG
ncbi:MAG TPA: zf-HC2 domain-containing protein [Gemmatimonadaceae bacterium]|jgi:hypothetical protein